MVSSIQSGIRKVVLNSGDNYFTDDEVPLIIGSYANADWCADMLDCFRMVCNESSRVGLFYNPDIYKFFSSSLTDSCSLVEIPLARGESSGIGWLTRSLTEGDFYTFVTSKEQPRWAVEKINWALLTVYTDENLNSLFLRRSLPFDFVVRAARKQESDLRKIKLDDASPLSFLNISIPLEILSIGLTLSAVSFGSELIVSRVNLPNPVNRFRRFMKQNTA
ncbi:hypothetical protein PMAYCL1PPCAC_12841, partial [Pristionchus mayeri]